MTPMQRYEWATGPDGWLTAAGWERLADDLIRFLGYAPTHIYPYWTDRVADCRRRAASQRAGAMATLASISRPL